MITTRHFSILLLCVFLSPLYGQNRQAGEGLIPISRIEEYVSRFNEADNELYVQLIPNSGAAEFLSENIPRFECPDRQLEEIYYFRWWTFRKHIKQTPDGYILTEFLPAVPWAGKYNGISCPAMHHYSEGRWLHKRAYLDSYAGYWLRGGGSLRSYTFPVARSLYSYYLATDDDSLLQKYLPDLIANFEAWEKEKFDAQKGLFWQNDGNDGMEVSICGRETSSGYRVTINSAMIAEAKTIAAIARRFGHPSGEVFEKKAATLHENMLRTLWDKDSQFFKVIPKKDGAGLCDARELHGYTPWFYSLADEEYAAAWQFLTDSTHFYAPYGPTTAERCHPGFTVSYEGHECQWNGPSWPFATSVTLTALANLLNEQQQDYISKKDYFDLLKIFAKSHYLTGEDGVTVPWIDENLNPFTGDWIARTRLKTWENGTWSKAKGGVERGKDYNHSSFCDLVITGLAGVRPQEGNELTVNPLIPTDTWDYFCLENVLYKGHKLTILYDKSGKKYKRGKGLRVFVDGVLKAKSNKIEKLSIDLGVPAMISHAGAQSLYEVPADLAVPAPVNERPQAGKRVRFTTPGWEKTDVYHTLYLPPDWTEQSRLPLIVEYAGNGGYRNGRDVSDGTVDGCILGYGLTAGKNAIWVCLPFVKEEQERLQNCETWWGSVEKTKQYCVETVEDVCRRFGGDPQRVILAGFSRGSIACFYIGLHDDNIARLWAGFFCHSHLDGVNEEWGYAGADRVSALTRLKRLGTRPVRFSQEGNLDAAKRYLESTGLAAHFEIEPFPYPNHTAEWVLRDLPIRERARLWLKKVITD